MPFLHYMYLLSVIVCPPAFQTLSSRYAYELDDGEIYYNNIYDWASFIGTRTETHFIGGYYI